MLPPTTDVKTPETGGLTTGAANMIIAVTYSCNNRIQQIPCCEGMMFQRMPLRCFKNVTFACDLDQEVPQGLMKLVSSETVLIFVLCVSSLNK